MRGDWPAILADAISAVAYYKYAVDFDGDGRRDLVHSVRMCSPPPRTI